MTEILLDPTASRNVGIPRDMKGARAALRFLGAWDAGTGVITPTKQERDIDRARLEAGWRYGRNNNDDGNLP